MNIIIPQAITSKNTSVNTTKVPYLFNHIDWEEMKERWGTIGVFDYGCGRKIDHNLRFFQDRDIRYVGYDPYWGGENLILKDLDAFHDMIWRNMFKDNHMSVVLCSNVLNILPEEQQIMFIHKWIMDQSPAPYFIKIYAGDKSGVGRMTKDDCWQQNKPTRHYVQGKYEVVKKDIITHHVYAQFIK